MQNKDGIFMIEFGGEKRPFMFGPYQASIFCQLQKPEMGIEEYNSMLASGIKSPMKIIEIIYSAIAAGCEMMDREVDFKKVHVGQWMGEEGAEKAMEQIFAA